MVRAERMAILAEGKLGVITSKTAACVIRYQPGRVRVVIDSTKRGVCVEDVLGFGGRIPIVPSIEEALGFGPDSLLMGIAPQGGALPEAWRPTILTAIRHGLNILSGLHTMLGEDSEIGPEARSRGVQIWDIRKPDIPSGILRGILRNKQGRVLLTIGSDCSSGKMTVAYELALFLRQRGVRAEFVPTGQTGIILAGWGQAIDRVPGDFMARVAEDLTLEALGRADLAIVEGQGSLVHPAYSGVTLALLHACCADGMIFCHQPSRGDIKDFDVALAPVADLIPVYEQVCAPVFRSKVIAVALNTFDMEDAAARAEIERTRAATGLPTSDVVRFGCEYLYPPIEAML